MSDSQLFHVEQSVFGVYVHVPFCVSVCGYCDFCRVTDLRLVDSYLAALGAEMRSADARFVRPRTVYLGGGTPSSIGVANVDKLLSALGKRFDLSDVEEFTVECNPDDVDAELVATLVKHGVSRVSMGAQSLNDAMLRYIGRRHDSAQVRKAIGELRRGGINNISVDCIFGLPEVEGYSATDDFKEFALLRVEHLSAYALSYEEGSRFSKMLEKGELTPRADDEVAEQYETLCDVLCEAGYGHYEISNFAKPGLEARHNSSYWDRTPYLGFGPAASSLVDGVRTTNTYNIGKYVQSLGEKKELVERLTEADVYDESVMLGLRTSRGVSEDELPEAWRGHFAQCSEPLLKRGDLVRMPDGRIRIPEPQWFVADGIISSLFA